MGTQTSAELTMGAASQTHDRSGFSPRTFLWVLAAGACYYLATRIAWVLSFPGSKVSLFFFPHAVLVSIFLLIPVRHWWACALAAIGSHFFATQQEHWPPLYALQCEAFDVFKAIVTAAGIRLFIKSPFHLISLREATLFVVIAVFLVPVASAFWGAAFTVANNYGSDYWVEWRNLGISNGVTTLVLVPAILIAVDHLLRREVKPSASRIVEGCVLGFCILATGWLAFDQTAAGPDTSPALLYAPVPLLIWAALRFGPGGISASMLAITIQAIWGTMHGRGPFLAQTPPENALALQLFILVADTPLLLLAVAIRDERRSKEALRLSERRLSLAAQSAQLALWDWDLERDEVWIQDEGLFGFEPYKPIDHATLAGRVHPDDRAVRAAAIEKARANGGSYESEFRAILADGSVRWIAARGRSPSPVNNGAPSRILGVAIDITQQKEAGAQAQLQREELAHLSRVASVSALSSSLAHELSQPLSSILINAQAGQRFMAQPSPDLVEIRTIFEEIVSADSRAGEIIDGLRTMLRRGQVALGPVNVNESLDELLRLIRANLNARQVTISKVTTTDLPSAMTDRVQLQQVLLNLIVNACDAMQNNPPEDRILTLTTSATEYDVRIGVVDRGVGLPDDIESLFRPFHSTKVGGLGLGLSICRTLVTSQGGKLWAERGLERGAAFYVELPAARQAT
jgi:PAS domain S-box-containing protein